MTPLTPEDLVQVAPLLEDLLLLERSHSRLRTQWLELEATMRVQEGMLAERLGRVKGQLDSVMAALKSKYGGVGVFDVDARAWRDVESR